MSNKTDLFTGAVKNEAPATTVYTLENKVAMQLAASYEDRLESPLPDYEKGIIVAAGHACAQDILQTHLGNFYSGEFDKPLTQKRAAAVEEAVNAFVESDDFTETFYQFAVAEVEGEMDMSSTSISTDAGSAAPKAFQITPR